jgi:hypothetical protein
MNANSGGYGRRTLRRENLRPIVNRHDAIFVNLQDLRPAEPGAKHRPDAYESGEEGLGAALKRAAQPNALAARNQMIGEPQRTAVRTII